VVAPAPSKNNAQRRGGLGLREELETRSNYSWSPDSLHLAYLQMDESAVPEYPIADWIPTQRTVEMQRYPQPGDPNPSVRVGVVSADGGKTIWISLPIRAGQDYIPRFGWVDAKTLWIETLTRDQKHRDIYFADASTGQSHAALELTDKKFFNDKYDVLLGARQHRADSLGRRPQSSLLSTAMTRLTQFIRQPNVAKQLTTAILRWATSTAWMLRTNLLTTHRMKAASSISSCGR